MNPIESAKRLVQLYPRESFTFPHMTMECRVALIARLLELKNQH